MPSYPGVPFADLNDGAAERTYADDRMVIARTITNEEGHRPTRRARVLIAPSMAEVSPDVFQSEACVLASGTIIDKLKIGVDDVLQVSDHTLRS